MEDKEFIVSLLSVIKGDATRLLEAIEKGDIITANKADSIREAATQLYQNISQQEEGQTLLTLAHQMIADNKENIDGALKTVIEFSRKRGASDGFWRGCQH